MSLCSSLSLSLSSPKSFSFLPKTKPLSFNGVSSSLVTYRFRASVDVPDFLFADWYTFDSTYWIVGFFIFSFLSWTFKIMLPVTRILTPRKTMIGLRWNWIRVDPHLIILCSIETELMHWSTMTSPVKIMESRLCTG